MKKYVVTYLLILLVVVFFLVGSVLGLFYYYSDQLPPLSELQSYDMKVGSEVYDLNDNLIHIFAVERRSRSDLRELPPYLIDGLLAVEDRNFYNHWGVDLRGIVRAIMIDITRGHFAQGASTITQQLARNMFLTLDKQIPRKIKEFMLAMNIEKNYAKDEILEMYLDKVYLGGGVYGVEAASKRYFGKEAKDLTIPEAALIIGLIQLPNAYSPVRFPDRALRRRTTVLRVMYDRGVISKDEFDFHLSEPIVLTPDAQNKGAADYFIEHIRRYLEGKYGTNQLFTEGLKIYTTIDFELQVYADSVLNRELSLIEERQDYEYKYIDFPPDSTDFNTPYLQGGVFAIDPHTGYVKIMVGGRNFNHSKFNRITQARRQPGSSFKPILYTAALQNRYTAATVIKDEPVHFVQSDTLFWAPRNYSPTFEGYIRLREAISKSINTVAVKTIVDIGPSVLANYARRFGITTPVRAYYSSAIGSIEVLPIEIITAYTTYANGGELVKPIFIRRVEDREGNILESARVEKVRVIDERTAYIMSDILRSVVDEGTARGIRWRGYNWFAAGKTGTTDDYRDAWFIGFNNRLVLGIWSGFDDNTSLGRNMSGATVSLPSWPYIMRKAIERDSPLSRTGSPVVDASLVEIKRPNGITNTRISKRTGLLPRGLTEETLDEVFISGTEPTPLSDSLNYNFYPTMYRENIYDTLIVNLGGKRIIPIIDSLHITDIDSLDTSSQDSLYLFDSDAPNVVTPRR